MASHQQVRSVSFSVSLMNSGTCQSSLVSLEAESAWYLVLYQSQYARSLEPFSYSNRIIQESYPEEMTQLSEERKRYWLRLCKPVFLKLWVQTHFGAATWPGGPLWGVSPDQALIPLPRHCKRIPRPWWYVCQLYSSSNRSWWRKFEIHLPQSLGGFPRYVWRHRCLC